MLRAGAALSRKYGAEQEQTPFRSFESPTGFAINRTSLVRPTFAVVFTGLSARLSAPAGA